MSKTPGFILDAGFFSKPRNALFWSKHGGDGLCIIFAIWAALSQEGTHFLEKEMLNVDLFQVPRSISQETFQEVIAAALDVGLLELDKKRGYFNSKILSDSTRYQEKIQNYKNGRVKRESETSKIVNENSPRILPESSEDVCNVDVNVYVDDLEAKKLEGGGGGIAITKPQKPDNFSGKTKQQNTQVYLGTGEFDKLIERYAKEKLSREWVDRGIELLDAYYSNKSTKRGCATKRDEYVDDYRVLISWPLQRCVQEAAAKVNLSRQRSYANSPPPYKQNAPPPQISNGSKSEGLRPIGQIIGKLIGQS